MAEIDYIKFFELSNQVMLVVDMDGYILKANKQFYDILGYSEFELKGKKFWDLVVKNDYQLTRQESDKVISGEISRSFVNRYKKKNGKYAYMEWNSFPNLEENKTYAIGQDITELLFHDSILQDVALSIPGTIFKIIKLENGTYDFSFANQKLTGIFQNSKPNDIFLNFIETLSEESQFIFLKELELSEKDLSLKTFNVFLKESPNELYLININPIKEGRNLVFYGVSTKISDKYLQKSFDKEKLKNQVLNRNKGYYIININGFNIDLSFEEKKKVYLESIIVDCNDFFAQVNGLTRDKMLGRKIKEIKINSEDVDSYLTRLIQNNYNLINNISYQETNNTFYSSNVSSIIENNYLIQLTGYFEDVSSQLLKQKQLEQSEHNYKQIFENSPVGIVICDNENIYKYNCYAHKLFEVEEDEILNYKISYFINENSLDNFLQVQNTILQYGSLETEPPIIEVKTLKQNLKYVQITGHSINYNKQECIQFVFLDVTEKVIFQKENEKNLRQLESILDNSTDYIVRVNSNGIFTFCNKAYINKVGIDIIGKEFKYNLAPGQENFINEKVNSLVQEPNKKINFTLNKVDNNGNYFYVNWDFIVIFEDGEMFIQCVGRDITELTQIQRDLEIANQKYKESATLANLGYWEFIPDKDYIFWDDNLYNILGYDNDVNLNFDFAKSLVKENYINKFEENLTKAIENKEIVYYEYELQKSDGNYIFINGFLKAIFDRNDNLVKLVATLQDITELKNKELEANKNKKIYEAVFESTNIGLVFQDKNDKILLHNSVAEEILGLTKRQLLGLDSYDPLWRAVDENGYDMDIENVPSIKTVRTNEPVKDFIMGVHKPDGNLAWLLINTEIVSYDKDNRVETYIVSFMDITEVKKISQNLNRANLLLKEVGIMSLTGAWEYNIDTKDIYWSNTMYDIYGVDDNYITTTEIEEQFYKPSIIDNVKEDYYNLFHKYIEIDKLYDFKDAKGVEKKIRLKGRKVGNRIIGITQDVTYLIKKENELKFQEASIYQLKNAINQSSIVSYTDIEGKIIEVNDKFTEIYGYTKDEILNKDHKILTSGKHTEEFWQKFWKTIKSGNIWTGEICNKAKDGRELWFYATIFPLKDSNGLILNFLEILIDISLNKQYEKELELQVANRTKELNDSLIEKDFILQMVSHDLKNPLTGIMLQAELIKNFNKEGNSKIIEKVKTIIDSTKRMNLIINNLLEFENLNRDTNLLINKVDIKNILKNIQDVFQEKLNIKSQKLVIDIPEEDIFVKSNQNHLFQILENLVSNASKFSQSNTNIKILVNKEFDNINISILDEGPGLNDEDQKKLFRKFTKLSNKPTGDEVSSGLGLAIVKKLCDLLNHKISVESTLNIGTIFTISIQEYSKN